jgi:DNA processing protein
MKNNEELQYWVSLLRVPGVGPKNFQKLLTAFASPKAVFAASINSLKEAGIRQSVAESIKNASLDEAKPDLDWLHTADNHHIITLECKEYPQLLKQISNPPPLLYVHGNVSLLNDPQLAIVGSRNPTQGGKTSAYDFAKYLAQSGLCISSGLALGIDGIAHQGALDADAPTIAVIATGIDRVYPARHRDLAHKIVKHGAIVSEFPIGVQPKAENFPRRNRIISGLSHGTLVVEAALQSGSLITARLASEQGREVFAIPGSIHNPLARGCHQLIRQGAKLVETAQDIFDEMSAVIDLQAVATHTAMNNSMTDKPMASSEEPLNTAGLDSSQELLLDKMGYDPVQIDQLVPRTEMTVEEISAMLLILELQNYVSASGSGTYTRIKSS